MGISVSFIFVIHKRTNMRKLILIPFLSLLFTVHTVNAQNTPALWKHSCNCGAMEMMLLDTNQNVYVFNDGSNSNGISSMIKLSPLEKDNEIGIIFYPGGKVEYTAYIPILEELVSLGYTCYLCQSS